MRRSGQGDIFFKAIRGIYEREFVTVSEYIYYSLILREEYPYIADLFDLLAISEIDLLAAIGDIMQSEGWDTSIDIRVRRGQRGESERLENIIKFEIKEIKESIRSCERLLSSASNTRHRAGISKALEIKAEALEHLDRVMRS
ncbi:MAG: hypothetical protein J6V42_03460 [Clostridia bacterium]|nr:hypothetical protein [Clostridia bacterium]